MKLIFPMSNRFKFFLERLLLRGAHFQLLIIAFMIVFVSFTAGAFVFLFPSEFKWLGQAVWWAFLRLSDPGYLGDDKGFLLASVSTIVTVLGYVLFMGALIAIMTQWLSRTMRNLEAGLTPITQSNHILILGWTNRTSTIVRELILSVGRVRRFLRRIGAKRLGIVILAEEVSSSLAINLQDELRMRYDRKQITFRSGTPLSVEHLKRVDYMNASVLMIPGADFASGEAELMDSRTIKALLTISNYGRSESEMALPPVVAEIFDARKIPIAKAAYPGEIEIIASDAVISRLIAQNVRHRGLSYIYTELLTHSEGNEIYIRECPNLEGEKIGELTGAFPNGILLGLLRIQEGALKPILNPSPHLKVEVADRLVLLAQAYTNTEPIENYQPEPLPQRGRLEMKKEQFIKRRVLVLGWNYKIPVLMQEFDSYENERFDIDILSMVPIAEREEYVARYLESPKRAKVKHIQADYAAPSDLQRADPGAYDNIIFIGNSWMESKEESDARTILGYLLLREMLSKKTTQPEILIELMDPENERLFQKRSGEVIISPFILGHILAHVALRRDLNLVFEELFTVGGAEIYFRRAAIYGVTEREIQFKEIGNATARNGDIALGVRIAAQMDRPGGGIQLNPDRDSLWTLGSGDEVVVLTSYI
jgi:hypothetical protein